MYDFTTTHPAQLLGAFWGYDGVLVFRMWCLADTSRGHSGPVGVHLELPQAFWIEGGSDSKSDLQ